VIACPDLIDGFREARGAVVAVRTEDGRILALNPAAELLLGWSASDVAGRSPSELSMWPDVATRARLWRDIGSRGCARGLDTVLRRRDGELLALQIDCETLQCAEGWVLLCWLRPRADRVDTAGDAGAEALWFRCDVQGRLLALSRPFRRLLGVDANLSDAALRHRDVPGFRARLRRAQDEGQTPIERCALTCGDGRIRWFEERLQRAGDGASLLAELRDVSAQVEQAEALRQQQALFNVLVDNCRDGVVLVQHGRVRFANAALADMLRRPLPELVGSEYMSLVHPDERAAQMARRQAREAGSTEAQRYRVRLLRGDGSTAVFEVNADAVWYEGALASSAVMRDITEESARQAALAAAERRYRELFETAPVGLFRTRLSGTILDVNQPMLRLLGYDSIEQLRAERQHATDLYTEPGERAAVLEELRQNGRIDARQLSLRARDGSLCWVSLSVREVAGEDGDTEVAGSVQDYSQRRLAELGLQRSERMYRALVEHAQVGVFVSDGERFSYANRTLCALLGTDEAELQARSVQAWRAPEHVEVAAKAWQRLRSGESESEEFESCYLRCDGARVWVSESVGRVDLDGRQQFTGTLRDITRQREVERRLRYYATHDALTGLPNRLDFQQRLDELIHEAQALGEHDYAVLFLDLDGFKLINDSLGHAAGDRLLVGLAGKVTDLLGGEALVARYGGDEFTILPY
jgi:PAS domain S-box-containing protein